MGLKVSKVDLWSTTIDDRAGGAADKIEPLAAAGANLEFVFARRTPEQPGRGILFVTPVKGAKVVQAARTAGFDKSPDIQSVKAEGTDKKGVGARLMRGLADAGVSFRAISASVVGTRFVCYIALDNAADVAKASAVLRKVG